VVAWIVGLGLLLVGTLLFRYDGGALDKTLTSAAYDAALPAGERFFLADLEPWRTLYEIEDLLTIGIAVVLLAMVLLGLCKRRFRLLATYGLFGIVSVAVGPGLLVNEVFKGLWGRPRPRDTELWPNSADPELNPWYRVWDPAFLDGMGGKSFPSGHVAIAVAVFVFFQIFSHPEVWGALFGRGEKTVRWLKWGFFILTFVLGGLMGVSRVVQGAHHGSDVLWAFGMTILPSVLLYWLVFNIPKHEERALKSVQT
jgi:membrane-associated phospholipid phosphatase